MKTNPKGDVYVYCRDNPEAEKVSLHSSGRQHISISRKIAERIGAESRFQNVWTRPEFESEAIATFTLVFPPWGVGRKASEVRDPFRSDELLIVGHRKKLLLVNFFIVDSARNMRGHVPHLVLGQIPLMEGKTLHIIAWKEPENGLMDLVRTAFPQASHTFAKQRLGEGDYTMPVQGSRGQNAAYMVVFPVRYTPAGPELPAAPG